tara:strand:+ start:147 stop:506 length:360 start_codon:yes stop_codon:yes gene_type:complete
MINNIIKNKSLFNVIMIYLCQTCGWRINERCHTKEDIDDKTQFRNDIRDEDIGKHLLYKHKAFCSIKCINKAKEYPRILNRIVVPSDWNEQGWNNKDRPNGIETWKTERKINRIRPKIK